jgi:hypothetical protein
MFCSYFPHLACRARPATLKSIFPLRCYGLPRLVWGEPGFYYDPLWDFHFCFSQLGWSNLRAWSAINPMAYFITVITFGYGCPRSPFLFGRADPSDPLFHICHISITARMAMSSNSPTKRTKSAGFTTPAQRWVRRAWACLVPPTRLASNPSTCQLGENLCN